VLPEVAKGRDLDANGKGTTSANENEPTQCAVDDYRDTRQTDCSSVMVEFIENSTMTEALPLAAKRLV